MDIMYIYVKEEGVGWICLAQVVTGVGGLLCTR